MVMSRTFFFWQTGCERLLDLPIRFCKYNAHFSLRLNGITLNLGQWVLPEYNDEERRNLEQIRLRSRFFIVFCNLK